MDLSQEQQGIPLTIDGRVNWGEVPYPQGSIDSIKSLNKQVQLKKQLYLVIPHYEEIHRVSVGPNYADDKYLITLERGGEQTFKQTNITERISTNANFVFYNYWQAYAYLLKFKNLPRSAYIT